MEFVLSQREVGGEEQVKHCCCLVAPALLHLQLHRPANAATAEQRLMAVGSDGIWPALPGSGMPSRHHRRRRGFTHTTLYTIIPDIGVHLHRRRYGC